MKKILISAVISSGLYGAEAPKQDKPLERQETIRGAFEKSTDDKRPERIALIVELTTLQTERSNKVTGKLEGEPTEREIAVHNRLLEVILGDSKE